MQSSRYIETIQITHTNTKTVVRIDHSSIFVGRKSQSVMEYLMTYGWAILIIAVVLVALFQMGVFNSANFAPKAQPGSYQVFKTVAATSLEGTCNNELPQYVAGFDGESSYIAVNSPLDSYTNGNFAVSFWANPKGTHGCSSAISSVASGGWTSQLFIYYIGENNVCTNDAIGI